MITNCDVLRKGFQNGCEYKAKSDSVHIQFSNVMR
jgi:hypothetical protein